MSRLDAFKGNRPAPDDGWRAVDAAQAPPATDPPGEEPACVPGRADPDRWQRSPLVRGTRPGVHAAGVHRRCDEPADDAALHRDGIHLQLFRGDAAVPRTARQAKASVFHCNNPATTAGKGVTQFWRALYELNVDTWC